MNITTKIDLLKPYVNYDKSAFVKETLEFPFDFYKAVEYALQEMGKEVRLYEKTIWIPLTNNKRYYNIDVSLYTSDLIDYVKPIELAYISTDGNVAGPLDRAYLEEIERNRFFDWFAIGERFFGKGLFFKTSQKLETAESGAFDKILTTPADDEITLTNSVTTGNILTNLDKSDQEEYFQSLAMTTGTSVTLESDVVLEPYNWQTGNIIYVSERKPEFMKFTFQSIPKDGYFTDGTIEIPILPQFLNDIEHFAVAYLYSLMIARNPQIAQIYQAQLSAGRIKPYAAALTDIKRRAKSFKPIVIKSYLPYLD